MTTAPPTPGRAESAEYRPLTPTVQGARDRFGAQPVTARDIVEAILASHSGDYAGGNAEHLVPDWQASAWSAPADEWLAEIDRYWLPDAFRELFGRIVILGAAMWDPSAGRAIEACGLFHALVREVENPKFGDALTEAGREALLALPLAAAECGLSPPVVLRLSAPGQPIALSADSRRAAGFSAQGSEVVIWDTRRGQELRRETGFEGPLRLWLNRDGTRLAVATGAQLVLRPQVLEAPDLARSVWVAFADDGESLVVAQTDGTYIVDAAGQHGFLSESHLRRVHVRGKRVLSVSREGHLRVNALDSQAGLADLEAEGSVLCGALASSGGFAFGDERGAVVLWDPGANQPRWVAEHGAPVRSVAFSADGRLLASGADDGLIKLWRVDNGLQVGELPNAAAIWDVAFDPSGTELQSTSSNGTTRRWTIGHELPQAPAYLADDADNQPATTWIDDDVDAFARLIASRHMSPPLSVAVFGDWGSGKTFFMRRLQKRIDRLSRQARTSGLQQRDVGYYKHIAQVEFNAWHYSNADLWASLVDNLFTRLWLAGDPARATDRIRALFSDAIAQDTQKVRDTNMEVHWLEQEQAAADQAIVTVEGRQQEVERQLEVMRGNERDAASGFVATLTNEQTAALSEAGYAKLGATPDEVMRSIHAAKAFADEARAWVAVIRARDRVQRMAWLVAAAALPLAIGALLYVVLPQVGPLSNVAGIGVALVSVLSWLQRQTEWLRRFRTAIVDAQSQAQQDLEPRRQTLAKAKAAAQDMQQQIAAELAAARDRREAAQQRLAVRASELAAGNPAALFARLVGDRAESDYYRKYLGLLSLVRRDFEAISDFVERDRRQLEDTTWSRQEESKLENKRVNRIVLYIDDLDRCPPHVVVNVLEAVHLLLSFPLFVVVVGVDARWVARALSLKYPDLLPDAKEDAIAASPLDYLEKIFQIPFWVEPLESGRVRQLLGQLVGVRTEAPDAVAATGGHPVAPRPAESGLQPPPASGAASDGVADQQSSSTPPVEDLSAHTLDLTDTERDALNEIAPLLIRSPRALKRFVNLYRLIRTRDYYEGFVEDGGTASDARVVMFLLALVTSVPDGANELFDLLAKPGTPPARRAADLVSAAAKMNGQLTPAAEWLQRSENAAWANLREESLQRWFNEVARYSFRPRRTPT